MSGGVPTATCSRSLRRSAAFIRACSSQFMGSGAGLECCLAIRAARASARTAGRVVARMWCTGTGIACAVVSGASRRSDARKVRAFAAEIPCCVQRVSSSRSAFEMSACSGTGSIGRTAQDISARCSSHGMAKSLKATKATNSVTAILVTPAMTSGRSRRATSCEMSSRSGPSHSSTLRS